MTYDPYQNRRPLQLHCLISLLQPMSQISETTGNEAALNVMPITDLEGETASVPIYSANAQRNGTMGRRSAMASFFDALGIAVNQATHMTFYAGGYIDGSTGNDLDFEAKARQFPALSLLGSAVPKGVMGAKTSQMMPGRMAIGDAYLVCYESAGYLYEQAEALVPEDCLDAVKELVDARRELVEARFLCQFHPTPENKQTRELASARLQEARSTWIPFLQTKLKFSTEWMTPRQKVRVPSIKQPELSRHLLASEKPKLLVTTDEPDDKKGKAKEKDSGRQMISSSWVIQSGAQLYSFWCAQGQGITDVEEGALVDSLLKFSETPYIGGQSGSGCGLVKLDFWFQSGDQFGKWLTIAPGNVQQLSPRAEESHQRYRTMLTEYRAQVDAIKSGEDGGETMQMLQGGGK